MHVTKHLCQRDIAGLGQQGQDLLVLLDQVRVEHRPERLGVGRGAHRAGGLPKGLDQGDEVAVLGEHGVDQQSGAKVLMRFGVQSLLLRERMRDQLDVTPSDQGVGRGAGPGQIPPGRCIDNRLDLDGQGARQLCVMVLDGLDGLGVCGAGCDNDRTHMRTPPTHSEGHLLRALRLALVAKRDQSLLHFVP